MFFNCGAIVKASDFFVSIQGIRYTGILTALEDAAEYPDGRYLVFLDELDRCQESARNALMPALDSTRRVFHPIESSFIPIPDNVQFIAAVNRGREVSATFGIDAVHLDPFAPLQMDYQPPKTEIEILARRHAKISVANLEIIVVVAEAIRNAADLSGSLCACDRRSVHLPRARAVRRGWQTRAARDVVLQDGSPTAGMTSRPTQGRYGV